MNQISVMRLFKKSDKIIVCKKAKEVKEVLKKAKKNFVLAPTVTKLSLEGTSKIIYEFVGSVMEVEA